MSGLTLIFFVSARTGRYQKRSAQDTATAAAANPSRHESAAGDFFPRGRVVYRTKWIVSIRFYEKLVGIHWYSSYAPVT
jgi:hypothetical protein